MNKIAACINKANLWNRLGEKEWFAVGANNWAGIDESGMRRLPEGKYRKNNY